jgi:hypothetical protein
MAEQELKSKHGLKSLSGITAHCDPAYKRGRGDRFGRMFHLAPLFTQGQHLKELGAKKGPMDIKNKIKARTKTVPVGQIFFGQFVDHDITLDTSSSLSSAVHDATAIENARTPTLDLDCIYGQGPEASPYLYHGDGEFKGIKLMTGADGTAVTDQDAALAEQDLCRSVHGVAIIGDPRNDENRVISQMQLAMIRFHNTVVDDMAVFDKKGKLQNEDLFEHARELVTWHYQWAVIHDYLPAICGQAVVSEILGKGLKFYCAEHADPFIPVEFSVAAYRFGHSMIPQKIKIKKGKTEQDLFGKVMGSGFKPLNNAAGVVDWRVLFSLSSKSDIQFAEQLDSKMASILLQLPFIPDDDEQSLATRNLIRGQVFMLPSGENIAEHMHRPKEEIAAIRQAACTLAGKVADLSSGVPLWLYLLLEAEKIGRETAPGKFEKGEGLGPVGARIVAETILGLIMLDARSFLASQPGWHPSAGLGISTVGEMLTYKGKKSSYPPA